MLVSCSKPGCTELYLRGGKCPRDHPESAATIARRKNDPARKLRSTKRWQSARRVRLNMDGGRCTFGTHGAERFWTERCPVTKDVDVHHIEPVNDGGAPYDPANLRTLCETHHNQVEQERRR
jgi:hypothetical protein